MTREECIDWLCRLRSFLTRCGMPKEWRTNFHQALSDVIKSLEQEPCDDAISREETEKLLRCGCAYAIWDLPSVQPTTKENLAVEQIKWERDVAIEQLKELGYGLGEKIRTDEDCISRQAVLDGLANIAKAKAKSDAQKSLMGRVMFFVEQI